MKVKIKNLRPDEPQSFDAFVKLACRMTHDGLLARGGSGLHSEMYSVLTYFVSWHKKFLEDNNGIN